MAAAPTATLAGAGSLTVPSALAAVPTHLSPAQAQAAIQAARSTLGAMLVGGLFAAFLAGTASVQSVIFYRQERSKDGLLPCVVGFLWLLDLASLGLLIVTLHHFFVDDILHPAALLSPFWSLMGLVMTTALTHLIVRLIFARRLVRLCRRLGASLVLMVLLDVALAIPSLAAFVAGFIFAVSGLFISTFSELETRNGFLLDIGLGAGAATDALLAAFLCIALWRTRTNSPRYNDVAGTLMMYAVNTGATTSIASIAVLLTFELAPHSFATLGIFFLLSRVVLNALLANLVLRPDYGKDPNESTRLSDGGAARAMIPNVQFQPEHFPAGSIDKASLQASLRSAQQSYWRGPSADKALQLPMPATMAGTSTAYEYRPSPMGPRAASPQWWTRPNGW